MKMEPDFTRTLNYNNGHASEAGRSILDADFSKRESMVCLLDDDSSVLKSTGRLLTSAGWSVELFTDPTAFLEFAKDRRPQVAVIDILMPLMNGLEVQKRLRGLSPATRVIVLTSKDDPHVRSQALNGGAAGFFLKPVRDDQFLAGIESAAAVD